MEIAEQIGIIYAAKPQALESERVARDVAFLHTNRFTVCERLGDFEAVPLTLYHCNVLRLANSPFLPPFGTPGPGDLSLFLWIISPEFVPGKSDRAVKARKKFFKRCRKFVRPASPKYRFSFRRIGYARRAGRRLALFAQLVESARAYVRTAFQDKPPAVPRGPLDPAEYYSDFAALCGELMRAYHGLNPQSIMQMPVAMLYQFLKEMRERAAAEIGKPAVLWNGSDRYDDLALALLNADKKPLSHEDAEFLRELNSQRGTN